MMRGVTLRGRDACVRYAYVSTSDDHRPPRCRTARNPWQGHSGLLAESPRLKAAHRKYRDSFPALPTSVGAELPLEGGIRIKLTRMLLMATRNVG